LLAIAAALNLLAHFPALFAIISVASTRPPLWSETLDRAGYWRLLLDPEVLSRVVHVWLAAFAVTGVALMILAKRLARGETNRESYDRLMRRGGWIALASTLLEIPSGLWLAFEMPEHARGALLGNDLWTSGLFAAALVMVFQLLHTLAAVALGDSNPRLAGRSAAITVLVVILMSTTRARLDDRAMAGHEGAALRAACDSGFAPADGRGLASRKS
jgi:hypothetical protein